MKNHPNLKKVNSNNKSNINRREKRIQKNYNGAGPIMKMELITKVKS
jgi:hypothetical protein